MNKSVEDVKRDRYRAMSEILLDNLEKRHYEAYYCDTKEEAAKKAVSLIKPSSSVSWGGSVTLEECGLLNMIREGPFKILDRSEATTPEEKAGVMRHAFSVDCYLTSFNAMSMSGKIINIDGTGNRVAAMIYGPTNVIAVVGMNKVCMEEDTAYERAWDVAAQLNAARFGRADDLYGEEDITSGHPVDDSICNVVTEFLACKPKNRIKIILVGEDLGY